VGACSELISTTYSIKQAKKERKKKNWCCCSRWTLLSPTTLATFSSAIKLTLSKIEQKSHLHHITPINPSNNHSHTHTVHYITQHHQIFSDSQTSKQHPIPPQPHTHHTTPTKPNQTKNPLWKIYSNQTLFWPDVNTTLYKKPDNALLPTLTEKA